MLIVSPLIIGINSSQKISLLWILANSYWNDNHFWIDNDNWND